jgi:hypothetical protein
VLREDIEHTLAAIASSTSVNTGRYYLVAQDKHGKAKTFPLKLQVYLTGCCRRPTTLPLVSFT